MPEPVAIDYKTHILIGVRANGVMTVIADWPHVPRQTEVLEGIDAAGDVRPVHPDLHLIGGRQRGCERGLASAGWAAWPPVRLRGIERREGEREDQSR